MRINQFRKKYKHYFDFTHRQKTKRTNMKNHLLVGSVAVFIFSAISGVVQAQSWYLLGSNSDALFVGFGLATGTPVSNAYVR